MKMKIKTTGFWLSLSGAILILVQTIGNIVGFAINAQYFNEIVTSICGVLVVVGVLIPTKKSKEDDVEEDTGNIDLNIDDVE